MGFQDVVHGFIKDLPFEKKWCPITSARFAVPYRTLEYGEDRKWLIAGRNRIRLALRVPGTIILNADLYPSRGRNDQIGEMQSFLRSAFVGQPKGSHVLIPFAALRPAHIPMEDIRFIDRTFDTYTKRRVVCQKKYCRERPTYYHNAYEELHELPNGGHTVLHDIHRAGESFFSVGDRRFVCGFDRNDGLKRSSFYLTELPPSGKKAKTVDEALLTLRPPGLPETTLRQGEWFFVPTGIPTKDFGEEVRTEWHSKKGVPIVTADAEDLNRRFQQGDDEMDRRRRDRRHVASKVTTGRHVYAAGTVKDVQHDDLRLGDGKEWFRVVKNLAVNGWTSNGKVD